MLQICRAFALSHATRSVQIFRSYGCNTLDPPVVPFLTPFLGEGSPTKIDYRKKGTLFLTSLLEDLERNHPGNHQVAKEGCKQLTSKSPEPPGSEDSTKPTRKSQTKQSLLQTEKAFCSQQPDTQCCQFSLCLGNNRKRKRRKKARTRIQALFPGNRESDSRPCGGPFSFWVPRKRCAGNPSPHKWDSPSLLWVTSQCCSFFLNFDTANPAPSNQRFVATVGMAQFDLLVFPFWSIFSRGAKRFTF